MKVVEAGTEEGTGLVESLDSALYQQFGKYAVDAHFGGKAVDLVVRSGVDDYPFAFFHHSLQI